MTLATAYTEFGDGPWTYWAILQHGTDEERLRMTLRPAGDGAGWWESEYAGYTGYLTRKEIVYDDGRPTLVIPVAPRLAIILGQQWMEVAK